MRNLVMALVAGCIGVACVGVAYGVDEPTTVSPASGEAPITADGTEPDAVLFDKKGKLNRSAYLRLALDGSARGVDRRLGPDADSLEKSAKASVKPKSAAKPAGSKKKNAESEESVTGIWQPPEQQCPAARNGAGMPFTIGGPPAKDGGDFSSSHAQVLYVPDKGGDPGVDRISILDMAHNVFTCKPEPTWWGGSHPEPAVSTPAWAQAVSGQLGMPVAMARANGNWANSGLMIFTSGLVGPAGTCTSQSDNPFLLLPKGKIPTAIAITNKSEFALITVWDVEKLQGQIAVLALESMHKDGLMGLYEWHEQNPGLPSVGGIRSMKLLGFIDLPFATPTAISAVGNRMSCWITVGGKNSQPSDIDLSKQAARDGFYAGENADVIDTCGFAVVASLYEHKASFIDLQPLFAYYREMYFTTQELYQKTRDQGPQAKQWPYSFDTDARAKPVVVKTVTVKQPTVVNANLTGGSSVRAFIATADGRLQIYRVGGLATDAPVVANDIGQVGEVRIGKNPTCIAYSKNVGWGVPDTITAEVIVVCRGEREIQWIKVNGDTGEVTRRLRDPVRLKDPVFAEVADTHGTESHVLSVVDFKGRKVVNYRFGPVVFHTNGGKRFGMGKDGNAEFECGGEMSFPGFPFALCGTNVN